MSFAPLTPQEHQEAGGLIRRLDAGEIAGDLDERELELIRRSVPAHVAHLTSAARALTGAGLVSTAAVEQLNGAHEALMRELDAAP